MHAATPSPTGAHAHARIGGVRLDATSASRLLGLFSSRMHNGICSSSACTRLVGCVNVHAVRDQQLEHLGQSVTRALGHVVDDGRAVLRAAWHRVSKVKQRARTHMHRP